MRVTFRRKADSPDCSCLDFELVWKAILKKACADTLLIVDACYGGMIQRIVKAPNSLGGKSPSDRKIEISTSSTNCKDTGVKNYTEKLVRFMERVALENASEGFTMSEARNAILEQARQDYNQDQPAKNELEHTPDWFKAANHDDPMCNIVVRPSQDDASQLPDTGVKRKGPDAADPSLEPQAKRVRR